MNNKNVSTSYLNNIRIIIQKKIPNHKYQNQCINFLLLNSYNEILRGKKNRKHSKGKRWKYLDIYSLV